LATNPSATARLPTDVVFLSKYGAESAASAYIFATISLCTTYAFVAIHGPWVWDFWAHAAIARTLGLHPLSFSNPFYREGAPDVNYWLYDAAVGLLSRAAGSPPHAVLAAIGFFNLLFLLHSVRCFSRALFGNDLAAIWGLLFTLFGWGIVPWPMCVLQIGLLFYCAPYPSMLVTALTLRVAAELARGEPSRRTVVLLYAAAVISAQSHLVTFGSLALLCLCVASIRAFRGEVGSGMLWHLAATIVISGLMVVWSPFFPLRHILADYAGHEGARMMYQHFFQIAWPSLLGILLLVCDLRRPISQAMALFGFASLLVYGAGYLCGMWNVGRIIVLPIAVVQLYVGAAIAGLSSRIEGKCLRPGIAWGAAIVIAAGGIHEASSILRPTVRPLAIIDDLGAIVRAEAVVMADQTTALHLPALGAHVVVIQGYADFFGPTYEERLLAVRTFYAHGASDASRANSVCRYQTTDLLVAGAQQREALASFVSAHGLSPSGERGDFTVYPLDAVLAECKAVR
jgi:hypothetical protein